MLFLNGEVEETALRAGVMNHPAHGIQWVCRRFAPHGIGLEPASSSSRLLYPAGDRARRGPHPRRLRPAGKHRRVLQLRESTMDLPLNRFKRAMASGEVQYGLSLGLP